MGATEIFLNISLYSQECKDIDQIILLKTLMIPA